MSIGPTQRLWQRARDWADDAEELASLQWELLLMESAELTSELKRGLALFAAAAGCVAIGLPLAIVAGLAVLAQSLDWPLATTLAVSGLILLALAAALALAGKTSWAQRHWLPRTRRQAVRNLRALVSSWKSAPSPEGSAGDDYFPD